METQKIITKNEISINYYQSFEYRIEKKISVEDYPKIKDYAKQGIYLYIIHDLQDNNRFLYLSSKHYELNTKIYPYTFNIESIATTSESVHLKILLSTFGVPYYQVVKEKGDISIVFNDIIYSKNKDNKLFKKFKTHTKKIVIDYPDWYLREIKKNKCNSYRKRLNKILLCNNKYNSEIFSHAISTFFIISNPDYQKFNDHSIILDEGKTGKSSLIGYMGEKIDNVSIAGLYGSSDSKQGKFRGGIVTLTQKPILIDEMNELIKNNKGEKILSVLNSLLENGVYNYQKQFGQKITASNQFFFMGNIGKELNFPLFNLGSFGNVETLGRRIGLITYNLNLNGFTQGLIRPLSIDPFLNAISIYMTNLFNSILQDKKFIEKLYQHKEYIRLSHFYKNEINLIIKEIEDDVTKQFMKSHSQTIDRVVCRGLKIWIYNNLDLFICDKKKYDNHSLFEILQETEKFLKQNILNFKNIKEHIIDYSMTDKTTEINKNSFDKLSKTEQNLLKFFWLNKDLIDIKGISYKYLDNQDLIKKIVYDYKRYSILEKHNNFLRKYGLYITKNNDEILFKVINKNLFENHLNGIFNEINDKQGINIREVKKDWNKDNIEEINIEEDL